MGERFLAFGILIALASAAFYFTRLSELGALQGLHHAVLIVMVSGTVLALWGFFLLRKFQRDEL